MKTYCPEHDTDPMGCGEDCPSRRPLEPVSDCPPCERIDAFLAKIDDLPYGMQEDAQWIAQQLRGFQQWSARVVALGDHIEALTAAVRIPPVDTIVAPRAERVREEYESLFKQPEPPREAV